MGLPKGAGKGQAGDEKQSWSEPSPTATFTEFHSPWEFRFLHWQIVIDACVHFFFLFLCFVHSRLFLLPRESGRKPQLLCFPSILQPKQNPGSASLTEGFRVPACNSLRNPETCAFLYNLYLLLYLEKHIGCFSHTHAHKYVCLGFNTVIIQLH